MKDQQLYLEDILQRIVRIEDFTAEGHDAFAESVLVQDAVIRSFEVIGEAVKRLSPELTQRHSGVPWRRIAGFRDVLIHQYDDVDVDEVWEAIEKHLPPLKKAVQALLNDVTQGDSS